MGCGTSKDIPPLPPQSIVQTSSLEGTGLQQAQAGTIQAISCPDVLADQPADKVAIEPGISLLSTAESSNARQPGQPSVGPIIHQSPRNPGQEVDDTVRKDLLSQEIGAAQHEEDVQPFQDVLAGNEGEGSPWAYLQKTYSNTEEAVQGSSEGQDHNLLQGRAVTMPGHTISSAALPVQAGGIVVHNGTSRPGVRSIVPENAWGDAAAVSGAAALSDVPNQYPPMGPSGVKCLPAQVVVDDLGIEDVDEFEAELAAVNDAKSA